MSIMGKFNTRFLLSLLVVTAFNFGCKGKASQFSSSDDSTTPTTPPTAPVVSAAAPLALNIFTKYDKQEYVTNHIFQESGTTTCSSTTGTPKVTCTISVPEGRMFLSNFHFQFSWLASKCNLMTFQPNVYKVSNSAAYVPINATDPIDCSLADSLLPIDCFNGVAPQVVPDFPKRFNMIYTPNEADLTKPLSAVVDVASAFSLNRPANNRLIANDLPVGKQGNTYTAAQLGSQSDGYVANSYRDYTLTCRDHYFDPVTYEIDLFIEEEDSAVGNPAINNFLTFKEVP